MISRQYFQRTPVHICTNQGNIFVASADKLIGANLFKENTWNLGIDQSTSATGVTVFNEDDEWQLLLQFDFRLFDSTTSVAVLKEILVSLFKDSIIKNIVIEDIYLGYNVKTFSTLSNLFYTLQGLGMYCESFNNAKLSHINSSAWRSGFITKGTQGRTRAQKKKKVLEECLRRYPILEKFVPYAGIDYDAFESLGVYLGWKAKNYDVSGNTKIYSSLPQTSRFWYKVFQFDSEGLTTKAIESATGYRDLRYYSTELDADETIPRIAKIHPGWFIANNRDELWLSLKICKPIAESKKFVIICGGKS